MTRSKQIIFLIPLFFSLCSYTIVEKESSIPNTYVYASNYTTTKSYGLQVGESENYDLGRRNAGIISQYLKVTLKDYKKYDASNRGGYVYDYDSPFINPKSLSEYKLTISTSYATQYTYSYSHTLYWDVSNSLNATIGISDVVELEAGMEVTEGESVTEGFSYSFGTTTTISKEYNFDLSKVPSGYVFTPCVVCSAEVFTFDYCVWNDYWFGDTASTDEKEYAIDESEIYYDVTTMFFTIGIKKEGTAGGPTYYLSSL